jgi:hypothetical protein
MNEKIIQLGNTDKFIETFFKTTPQEEYDKVWFYSFFFFC